MKAALFTGMFVLLLLATPTQTYALGLAEYGQAVAKADQPVLQLPRLNGLVEYFGEGQSGLAAPPFRETALLFFRLSQLLLMGTLLAGYWLSRRRSFRKYLVKARRAVHPPKAGMHAGAC